MSPSTDAKQRAFLSRSPRLPKEAPDAARLPHRDGLRLGQRQILLRERPVTWGKTPSALAAERVVDAFLRSIACIRSDRRCSIAVLVKIVMNRYGIRWSVAYDQSLLVSKGARDTCCQA